MPTIDIGIDYEELKRLTAQQAVPNGKYPFTLKSMEPTQTSKGRPMFKCQLGIKDENGGDHTLFYNALLPYMYNGQMDVTGCFTLVGLCGALGKPWTGGTIVTEDYVGRSGIADVVQKPKQVKDPSDPNKYIPDPEAPPVNEVKGFVTE